MKQLEEVKMGQMSYQGSRKSRGCAENRVETWLQRQTQLGIYDTLLQELRLEEEGDYKKFLRMSTEIFDELLQFKCCSETRHNDACFNSSKLAATIRLSEDNTSACTT